MPRPAPARRRAGRVIAAAITAVGVAAIALGVAVTLNRRADDDVTAMVAALTLIVTGAYLTARGARSFITGGPL